MKDKEERIGEYLKELDLYEIVERYYPVLKERVKLIRRIKL
jgi:hypothetical protein